MNFDVSLYRRVVKFRISVFPTYRASLPARNWQKKAKRLALSSAAFPCHSSPDPATLRYFTRLVCLYPYPTLLPPAHNNLHPHLHNPHQCCHQDVTTSRAGRDVSRGALDGSSPGLHIFFLIQVIFILCSSKALAKTNFQKVDFPALGLLPVYM